MATATVVVVAGAAASAAVVVAVVVAVAGEAVCRSAERCNAEVSTHALPSKSDATSAPTNIPRRNDDLLGALATSSEPF